MTDASAPHFIRSDGLSIATYVMGPADGTPLILVHGWPELAHSWSPLMPRLAGAGYRVIAYDLRGFGASDAPDDEPNCGAHHYGIANQVADLSAVMDAYAIKRAVICGHDWGGIIVWHAARMIAERVSGVISICTPHVGVAPADPIAIFRKRHGDSHYFVHFNDHPGVADALFARDPDAFFRLMFRSTPVGAKPQAGQASIPEKFQHYLEAGAPPLKGAVMSAQDHAVYVKAYTQSGFHGGIGLYRNTTQNWQLTRGLNQRVHQPCLMISPEDDLFLPPSTTDGMEALISDLTKVRIAECGHWAMWEHPNAVADAMLDWLNAR